MSLSAKALLGLALALGWPGICRAAPRPRTLKVSDGIYLFITAPHSDVGLDGNSVAIVSDSGVLVFDANGTPSAARAVLHEIRRITRQPVRYLVLSHWHWDHWYGAEVYRQAYPGIEIISHRVTRALMLGPAWPSISRAWMSSSPGTFRRSRRASPSWPGPIPGPRISPGCARTWRWTGTFSLRSGQRAIRSPPSRSTTPSRSTSADGVSRSSTTTGPSLRETRSCTSPTTGCWSRAICW